jgi:hypothetical protein
MVSHPTDEDLSVVAPVRATGSDPADVSEGIPG